VTEERDYIIVLLVELLQSDCDVAAIVSYCRTAAPVVCIGIV